MLYFDRIDESEGSDVNKTSASKESVFSHYWYFLDKGFKLQLNFCKRCHDVLMMMINLTGITVLHTNGIDYCCIINRISKTEVVSLLQNADLTEKSGTLYKL